MSGISAAYAWALKIDGRDNYYMRYLRLLFFLFATIYCFSIEQKSGTLRFQIPNLTVGIIAFRHTKKAHRVSFHITIFLVSWKQTQWAAYIPFMLFSAHSRLIPKTSCTEKSFRNNLYFPWKQVCIHVDLGSTSIPHLSNF